MLIFGLILTSKSDFVIKRAVNQIDEISLRNSQKQNTNNPRLNDTTFKRTTFIVKQIILALF